MRAEAVPRYAPPTYEELLGADPDPEAAIGCGDCLWWLRCGAEAAEEVAGMGDPSRDPMVRTHRAQWHRAVGRALGRCGVCARRCELTSEDHGACDEYDPARATEGIEKGPNGQTTND